mgnify:CR=1 FL=1
MTKLTEKTIIITGATGGIGASAAALFAREGARLMLVDLDEAKLAGLVETLGPDRAAFVAADVSIPEDAARYVAATKERFGRLDGLFSNAGIEGVVSPLTSYPIEVFNKVLAVNVRGVFLSLQHAMPVMEASGGGSIVITSSVAGLHGFPGLGAYVTSKHAVIGLMRCAALEGAAAGIRVNTIHPAPIETRMMRSIEEGAAPGAPANAKAGFEAAIPAGRYGTPEEVARLAAFLLSDESSYCSGGLFTVDGAMSAR